MAWDTNDTDIDLHVFEPSGEEAFYGHQNTQIGGLVSRDFTQGFGPEEYVLRDCMSGTYKVFAKFYASHKQDLSGATTILLTFFTDFAIPGREKRGCITLRLEDNKESIHVGDIQTVNPQWDARKRSVEAHIWAEGIFARWRREVDSVTLSIQRWWRTQRVLQPFSSRRPAKFRRALVRVMATRPPLNVEQKALLDQVFAKMDEPGWGIDATPSSVMRFLAELYMVSDEQTTRKYLDILQAAYPDRNIRSSLQFPVCEALYRVALHAQPLSTVLVRRSVSAASLPSSHRMKASDVHDQESNLRSVFERQAGKCGTIPFKNVGDFLSLTGVTDSASYTPAFLDSFHDERGAGPVKFPEIVGLCNTAVTQMLGRSQSLASKSFASSAQVHLPPLSPLGSNAAGLPALSLRKRRQQDKLKMSKSFSAGQL
eukprot:TRINITY_DN88742_c0_g1_i1.p1 TRINITY_DN88742_c0_g1~~TRINITY_DN88742_c0_g1_i1.p1  ORF type:complete len:493 (-),score=78.55 TRINITY_DN88742_c0_g1_i1:16-1296(-)